MQFFEIKRNTQEMTEKTETTQTEKNQKPTSAKQNFLKIRIIITQKKTRNRVFLFRPLFTQYLLELAGIKIMRQFSAYCRRNRACLF